MTQRELEKLIKTPEVLQELEQGLFGDPLLWASPEELKAAKSAEELLVQKRLHIKERVTRRVMETAEEWQETAPRRMGKRALQWSVAAACVAILACYIALYPQHKSLATSYDEKVARKVEGRVIIDSVETPPNVLRSVEKHYSGVDGYEMYSYTSIDEYIKKTGRDPVLLTGGYEKIVSIYDELDPTRGYILMIAYELPGDRYISTTQSYQIGEKQIILADSFEREVLDGRTMNCSVSDDSTSTWGTVRLSSDCIFYISVPYEEQFDPYLKKLAFASTLDTSSFVVPPIEPTPESASTEREGEAGPKDIPYETFEDYSRDTGYWPVVIDESYARPVSIELHTARAIGDSVSAIYEKDGLQIVAFQRYGFMDGTSYLMEDETYFTTKVLGKYTFHCSVDLIDGSAAGVAVVDGTAFFIIAEKGINFKEMLKHLYIMAPE